MATSSIYPESKQRFNEMNYKKLFHFTWMQNKYFWTLTLVQTLVQNLSLLNAVIKIYTTDYTYYTGAYIVIRRAHHIYRSLSRRDYYEHAMSMS